MGKKKSGPPPAAKSEVAVRCAYGKMVDINKIKPNPANPNTHPDVQIDRLALLIKEHGWRHPITVSKRSGKVVSGHCRLLAARKLNLKQVPVDYQDFKSDAEEYAVLIADNVVQELATIDGLKMADILCELDQANYDLALTALDQSQIEDYINGPLYDKRDAKDDEVPEPPEKAITKSGDLWLLGEHRVLCGNATEPADLNRLFDNKKMTLTFTSPPYDNNEVYEKNSTRVDYKFLIRALIGEAKKHLIQGGIICINIGNRVGMNNSYICSSIMEEIGLKFLRRIVWVKPKGVGYPTQSVMRRYPWALGYTPRTITEDLLFYAETKEVEELIFGSNGPRRESVRTEALDSRKAWKWFTDVWEIKLIQSDKKQGHPTAFPVELAENVILFFSCKNEIIYDPCSGSGSTLIACEKFNRKCYAMEIDPIYCDVIVKRWEQYTGKKAKLA